MRRAFARTFDRTGRVVLGRSTVVAACLAIAGCASGNAFEPSLPPIDQVFLMSASTWDVDRDGVVTCDEWKKYAGQLFKEAHGSSDGALTRAEFDKMSRTDKLFVTADFKFFDANGDGAVSFAELTEKPNPAFAYLDKNKDCRLTSDEMPSVWSGSSVPKSSGMPGTAGGRGGGR